MKTYSSAAATGERRADVPCDLCGSEERRPYLRCEGFTFVRCAACGFIYQSPRPVGNSVLQRYAEDYFRYEIENEENFFNLMLLGLRDVDFPSIERAVLGESPETREKDARRGSFLDIGCATGRLLAHMRERGWREQGVEVCLPSVEYARQKRGLNIFHGTLEEAGFPDAAFDVVHGSHVIEHVLSPRLFMREIRRILKPGGYALITTPNAAGWQARLLGSRWRSAIGDHLYLFTFERTGRFFEAEGFRVEKTQTWGGLAAGMGPILLKRIMDRAAKRCGTGDVMMFRMRKS